ncbi:transcriptional regulator [Cohnella sp. JJ-181]|uniref:LexA family protein n=1 Tax=Cohnella rhizoplanae TaxID=2974897 RepID=UPI00232DA072|nr:transcriptional regulator [Cohnella sp. JJ-181]
METKENVVWAIKALTDKLGYPPTVREIADASFISLSVAHGHLERLRKCGLVSWSPNRSRTIHLVKRGGGRHEPK